jgi:hypothetical protein
MVTVNLRKDAILFEKGLRSMLAKLAALFHSKVGIAAVGAILVAGGGAAVATTTGATSHLPLASFAQNGSRDDDDATKTPGGVGEQQEIEGIVASVNGAGSSFVLTVKHEADDSHGDSSDEHGTPTTAATPKSTTSAVTVSVTTDTKFEGVTKSFADLKAGMRAEVGGASQADGSVLAATIEASTGNDAENDQDDAHPEGEITGVVATVGVTSFSVKDALGATTTVTVSHATNVEDGTGIVDLRVGMRVDVRGAKQPNGSIAAQRVHGCVPAEDSGDGD